MTEHRISCFLTGSGGSVVANLGDRFRDDGVIWEITRFEGGGDYSPSSLGGTHTVYLKVVDGELSDWWKQWAEEDGTFAWCGDSVATKLCIAGVTMEPAR